MAYHRTILALLAIAGSVASQSYVVTPSPTTGVLGGTADFTCEVDPPDTYFEWRYGTTNIYFRIGDNEQYPGPGGQGRYSVAKDGGEYILTINDLQITDAERQYGCKVNTQGAEYATLIVLGQPSLSSLTTSKVEGTIATYSCETEFGGPGIDDITDPHTPTISLYQGNNEIAGELTLREPDGTNQYVIIKQSNITLTNAIDGEVLMCVTTTQVSSEMTNASMTIEVEYGVRDIDYEPKKSVYQLGEVITCTARGRPLSFEWTYTATGVILSDNAELALTESMVGELAVTCVAENTVDGEYKSVELHLTLTVVASQSYVVTPSPTTGVLGGTAEFTCEVDPPDIYFEWRNGTTTIYYRFGDIEQYPGPGGQGRYSVAKNGGEYILTINDLQITDAEEQYGCKVNTQGAEHATLIVLGQPSLSSLTTSKVEGTIATYSCETEFGGPGTDDITAPHFPTTSLYQGNNEITGKQEIREPDGTNQYVLTKQSNITLTNAIDGELLMCVTTTQVGSEMTNTSMTIEVEYGVRDIDYKPKKSVYQVGEVITCTARGRPDLSFQWTDTETGAILSDTAELALTENMVGEQALTCVAENTVDGELKSVELHLTLTVGSARTVKTVTLKYRMGYFTITLIAHRELLQDLTAFPIYKVKKLPLKGQPVSADDGDWKFEVERDERNYRSVKAHFQGNFTQTDFLRAEVTDAFFENGWRLMSSASQPSDFICDIWQKE